jgi:hypothetical protein
MARGLTFLLLYFLKISNPNMMFVENNSEHPLIEISANCWYLAGCVSGSVRLPSSDEMSKQNYERAIFELGYPFYRIRMDENYAKVAMALPGFWPEDAEEESELLNEIWEIDSVFPVKVLARTMEEGGYPLSLGTFEELNENGLALIEMDSKAGGHRCEDARDDAEWKWKTYRDCTDAGQFQSLFTGSKAVPLEAHWMDL